MWPINDLHVKTKEDRRQIPYISSFFNGRNVSMLSRLESFLQSIISSLNYEIFPNNQLKVTMNLLTSKM